jgi:hypothetical protein
LDRVLHAWLCYSVKPGKGSEDKPDRGNHHEAQEKIDQAEHESALKGVRNEHLQFSSVAAAVSLSASTFSTYITFSDFTPVHAGRAVNRLQKRQLEQRSQFLAGPIGADLANAGVGKRQRLRERHSVCPNHNRNTGRIPMDHPAERHNMPQKPSNSRPAGNSEVTIRRRNWFLLDSSQPYLPIAG